MVGVNAVEKKAIHFLIQRKRVIDIGWSIRIIVY